jgi:hypothetical protein
MRLLRDRKTISHIVQQPPIPPESGPEKLDNLSTHPQRNSPPSAPCSAILLSHPNFLTPLAGTASPEPRPAPLASSGSSLLLGTRTCSFDFGPDALLLDLAAAADGGGEAADAQVFSFSEEVRGNDDNDEYDHDNRGDSFLPSRRIAET